MTEFVGYSVFKDFLQAFFLFLLSSILCFFLHQTSMISPVMASSLVGLAGIALAKVLKWKNIELIVYGGSFAGMSSAVYMSSWWMFLISAVIGAVLFQLLEKKFIGWGGKLGAIAFLSLVIFSL